MNMQQMQKAISARARVEGSGLAAGVEAVAVAYRAASDSVEVEIVGGDRCGEFVSVPRAGAELAEGTVWYRRGDMSGRVVHRELPEWRTDDYSAARCETPLGEIAPPLMEGDGRRMCRTCALSDGELEGTRTMLHRFGG
ncbi:hypothetical protein [Streptomyces sp. B29(2018)]|uniref:hypothetical protein n=1 Tax=Streptomyces sp. B29(2018) TaxID=2485016 RepID=UPI000FD674E7|nr:hypothetical protein [Streptomyces sp. B29(2018)]